QTYQKGISVDPKSSVAVMGLGQFYFRQKRYPDAESQFKAALALDPKSAGPPSALASLYLVEGKKDDAENVMRTAKDALSGQPNGYRILGDFYLAQGDIPKATAEFATLYSTYPKDAGVAKTYAAILLLQNRVDDALSVDNAMLKGFPGDIDARVLQGEILTRQ